jgi:hypothetical protein
MIQELREKPFNRRAIVSIAMILTGLSLPIYGIMHHQLQLEPLTVERYFWMSVHNSTAILFTIFAILHISYNWRVLINCAKKVKEISISK